MDMVIKPMLKVIVRTEVKKIGKEQWNKWVF